MKQNKNHATRTISVIVFLALSLSLMLARCTIYAPDELHLVPKTVIENPELPRMEITVAGKNDSFIYARLVSRQIRYYSSYRAGLEATMDGLYLSRKSLQTNITLFSETNAGLA